MKALKSDLAKQVLADRTAAEQLRKAVERAVSSRTMVKNSNEFTYTAPDGKAMRLRADLVPKAM